MAFLTPPPDPRPRVPRTPVPVGACDCHLHLFGPASRYPFDPASIYVSGEQTAETYFEVQRALGLQRAVVVSAGAYGTDYSFLADTLERYGERLRGIILPPEDLSAAEIRRLDRLGVRGLRFVSERRFGHLPKLDEALARRAYDAAGWQVHFYPGDDIGAQAPRLRALPNTVVLDHFAGIDPDASTGAQATRALLELLESSNVWVKLSGPMRCTKQEFPYPAMTPLARELVAHAPERLIWGSDWPHVNMRERLMPNDGDLVDLLAQWVPEAEVRKRILVDNPAALFGF
jgi:2-pyrone-4,6-dicarboxylate lactonase